MKKLILITALFFSTYSFPQICCYSCPAGIIAQIAKLGLQGTYGVHLYSPDGLNDYINYYNNKRSSTLTQKMDNFGMGHSIGIGGSFDAFVFDDLIYQLKFYFVHTWESHTAKAPVPQGTAEREYSLKINDFGFTFISLAFPVSNYLLLDLLDVSVDVFSVKLTNTLRQPGELDDEQELENEEGIGGISLATGATYYIIPYEFALKFQIKWSNLSVERMQFGEGGGYLARTEDSNEVMENFIESDVIRVAVGIQLALPDDF